MDPTTTLVTFMLETTANIQSIHLVGSWDNFTRRYPMERDTRRDQSQWRGCYSFKDIICDGDGLCNTKRNGGLKMGSTYYYYYELHDGSEVHDPSVQSTTACPYLPGQPVNFMYVPIEVQLPRSRSASMSRMMLQDIMTRDPNHKYLTPCPPPGLAPLLRSRSAPSRLSKFSITRSISSRAQSNPWTPKNLFSIPSMLLSRNSDISSQVHISTPPRETDPSSLHSPVGSQFSQSSSLLQASQPVTAWNLKDIRCPTESILGEYFGGIEDAEFGSQAGVTGSDLKEALLPRPPVLGGASFCEAASSDMSKPLPELPQESLSPLLPGSFWQQLQTTGSKRRSHFSTSTISTNLASPIGNRFTFSGPPSDNGDATGNIGSGDEFTRGSGLDIADFQGYSLPESDYNSVKTLRQEASISSGDHTSHRFEPKDFDDLSGEAESLTSLQALLNEMRYLGDAISWE